MEENGTGPLFDQTHKIHLASVSRICLNNQYLFRGVETFFRLNGYTLVESANPADVIVINTCGYTDWVQHHNEELVLELVQRYPNKQFVVFGCLAQLSSTLREDPRFICIGPQAHDGFSELFESSIVCQDVMGDRHLTMPFNAELDAPGQAFIQIAQGCSHYCSYCNIKLAKGAVKSKSITTLRAESTSWLDRNEYEIVLLADDCGSYGDDIGATLPDLISELVVLDDRLHLKIYTIFPSRFLRYFPQLAPYFLEGRISFACIPLQSGSTRILELMNRRYDLDALAHAIGRIKGKNGKVKLFSHFITNFPTETMEDFVSSLEIAGLFDFCFFIPFGENVRTQAARLLPKCTAADLAAKTDLFQQAVLAGRVRGVMVRQNSQMAQELEVP